MAALQGPVSGGREQVSMHALSVQKIFPFPEHPLCVKRKGEERKREREKENNEDVHKNSGSLPYVASIA